MRCFLFIADCGDSSHFAFGKMLFTRKASLEADRPTGFCVAALFVADCGPSGTPVPTGGVFCLPLEGKVSRLCVTDEV